MAREKRQSKRRSEPVQPEQTAEPIQPEQMTEPIQSAPIQEIKQLRSDQTDSLKEQTMSQESESLFPRLQEELRSYLYGLLVQNNQNQGLWESLHGEVTRNFNSYVDNDDQGQTDETEGDVDSDDQGQTDETEGEA
jgi:hypothetical protein